MATPPPMAPPPGGDVNRADQMNAVMWTEIALAFIIVAMRGYVKIAMKTLGWDDWMMFATWVLALIGTIFATVVVSLGGARHVFYLNPVQASQIAKYTWIGQPFAILALGTAKVSVSLFLLKILGPNSKFRRWFLLVNMVVFSLYVVVAVIANFAQCTPVTALWEPSPDAKCWPPYIQANIAISVSAYSTFLDFVLAILPISVIWHLKVNQKTKIALCCVLGLGAFSGICSALKTANLQSLNDRGDLTWNEFSLYLWAATELFLLIVCGSAPTLKPLYDRARKGMPLQPNSKTSSYGSSGRHLKGTHPSNYSYARSGGYSSTHDKSLMSSSAHHAGGRDEIMVMNSFDVENYGGYGANRQQIQRPAQCSCGRG